jgi:hypothetical protein
MSTEQDKFNHSKRLHKDEAAVKKQVKIAKQRNSFPNDHEVIKEPHRLAKRHAMDCGNPECYLCGNPRHIHKDKLTAQEKRLFQDLESGKKGFRDGEEDLL